MTRPIVRTHHFDFERARTALRERVVAVDETMGGDRVRVRVEPLLARDPDGGERLWQSIRVDAKPLVALGTEAKVDVRSGDAAIDSLLRAIPTGIRVLVPAVECDTELELSLVDLGGSLRVRVSPQRHWDIHLVHHSHFDIGYTDPQNRVLAEHLSFLDSALDLVADTSEADRPDDARFRWAVEALLPFEEWCRQRPQATVEEFVQRVREGRIELTALPFNMHTETCSTEELHELLRPVRDLKRWYGLDVPTAMQTDVPGCVAGLVDALAENGVRYLSVAHNWAGRSVPHMLGGDRLPRLFRWASPDGNSVLVWVTDTPHGLAYMEGPMLGFDRSYGLVDDLLPAYLSSLATNPYPYDDSVIGWASSDAPLDREPYPWDVLHLRVQGRFGDNAPPRRIMAETVQAWNEQWAYPHLRLSTNTDFFADAERRHGHELQTFTGDWNDWWADGIGSAARPMQLVREAQSAVTTATTVSTIAGLRGAPGAVEDETEAHRVHAEALLFDEHTWGAGNPWTDGTDSFDSGAEEWHWKYAKALAAHGGATRLLDRALHRLGALSATAEGAVASYEIVNVAGRARGGIVHAFLPESRVPVEQPIAVYDARTGRQLPHESVAQVNHNHRDAGRHLLIAVDDVPAGGTVRVDVRGAEHEDAGTVETAPSDTVLDNGRLRVTLDPVRAGIASIVDQATGRELVDPDATFTFNGYVHDHYVSAGHLNHVSGRLEARDDLNLLGTRSVAHPAAIVARGSSPVRDWITYESAADGARWVRTTLTLWREQARLDIENRISKDAESGKESAYFAFGFRADDPEVRTEITGSVAGAGIASVPGGAEHMRAMRRWVSLSDAAGSIAWVTRDVPLVEIGDIAVPYAPYPGTLVVPEPATVFSWVHNNLWDTNFPSEQAFDASFTYSLAATGATDPDAGPALGAALADDVCTPLSASLCARPGSGRLPADAETGWLAVDDPRVRVIGTATVAPGTVLVRLGSTAAAVVTATLDVTPDVTRAERATFLGDPLDPAAPLDPDRPSIGLGPYGVAAILLTVPSAAPDMSVREDPR